MDFTLPPAVRDLQAATRRFIAEQVMPLERDPRQSSHGPTSRCAASSWRAPARPGC